jgi:hypothetical protein
MGIFSECLVYYALNFVIELVIECVPTDPKPFFGYKLADAIWHRRAADYLGSRRSMSVLYVDSCVFTNHRMCHTDCIYL